MAKPLKNVKVSSKHDLSVTEKISNRSLLEIGKENTKIYGMHVITNRALPDYRDGLKPVHRKILWAALKDEKLRFNGPHKKSAKVVGTVIGTYHPHSDQSIYDALVGMTHTPITLIDGQGNFGTLTDPGQAAMRYTECRLTEYSEKQMLDNTYCKVIKYHPTYDGAETEPLYLPALYPNLLLNGSSGIAVGITCGIPPLHPECLIPLVERAVQGKKITAAKLQETIRFNWRYGSNCVASEEDIAAWIKTGSGTSLPFAATYKIDRDLRKISFTDAPPYFNWQNIVDTITDEKKAARFKYVAAIDDLQDENGVNFEIRFKSSLDREDFMDECKKIIEVFTNSVKTATNVTFRKSEENIIPLETDPLDLIELWSKFRVGLEVRAQKYIIGELDKAIAYQNLLQIGVQNRAFIIKALDHDEPHDLIVKKLKISLEDAKTLLNRRVIDLARLNEDGIKKQLAKLTKEKKTAITHRDNPGDKVVADMSLNLDQLKVVKQQES